MSWFFIFFLATSFVFAADELEEIQVKAQKEVKDFSFSSTTEISAVDIEKKTIPLLSEQLNSVNGLVPIQSGGPGGTTSYFLRGTESRHIAFTLDGLKLNDTSGPVRVFDAAFFTSPMLKSVDIFKGPQAVLFGSDAFGGLIDMRSRKGEEAQEARLNLMAGSFGTFQASLAQDWGSKHHNGTITWSEFRTDGLSRLNKKRYQARERDGSDISQLSSSSQHRWASRFETDLFFSYLNGNNELDSSTIDTSKDHSRNDQYLTQQKTNYEIDKRSSISLRNGLNRHQRFIHSRFPRVAYDGNLIQNELIYRRAMGRLSLLAGSSIEHEDFKTQSLDKNIQVNSLFLQTAYRWNPWRFQLGGRADHHSKYGRFQSASAGVAYHFDRESFSLQYSQGYKAPTLYQLFAPEIPDMGSGGYAGGNPKLRPEINHSWEARWEHKNQALGSELVIFQNRLSNLVTYNQLVGYRNRGRLITEGVEVNGKWTGRFLKVTPGITHQKFRDNTAPVLRRPLNSAQLAVAYTPVEHSEFSFHYRWFSSRKDDIDGNSNMIKLNGYEVVNFGYRYVESDFDLNLEIQNILNREYEEIYGFSVMPRSFFAGIGRRFH